MARRILAIIKSGQPYVTNHNLSALSKIDLPTKAQDIIDEQNQEELDYKTGVASNGASPSL